MFLHISIDNEMNLRSGTHRIIDCRYLGYLNPCRVAAFEIFSVVSLFYNFFFKTTTTDSRRTHTAGYG